MGAIRSFTVATVAFCLVSAGAAVAAPSPTGLKLWFNADTGVLDASNAAAANGQSVGTWQDQSSSALNITQPDAAHQPTYSTSALNGHAALVFNRGSSAADNDFLQNLASNALTDNSARTIFVVGQAADATAGTLVTFRTVAPVATFQRLNLGAGQGPYIYSDGVTQNDHGSAGNVAAATSPFITVFKASSSGATGQPTGTVLGTVTSDFNGTAETNVGSTGGPTSNFRSESNGATGFTVGDRLDNGGGNLHQGWSGQISEVLVYDHVLSAQELNDTGNYLAQKYGITTTYTPEPGALALATLAVPVLMKRKREAAV